MRKVKSRMFIRRSEVYYIMVCCIKQQLRSYIYLFFVALKTAFAATLEGYTQINRSK